MKNLFISFLMLVASSSVWACPYNVSAKVKNVASTICADRVELNQLDRNSYRITFLDLHGTQAVYEKMSLSFDGKKEAVEKYIYDLDVSLKHHGAGDLYYDGHKFALVPVMDDPTAIDEAQDLIDVINSKLR